MSPACTVTALRRYSSQGPAPTRIVDLLPDRRYGGTRARRPLGSLTGATVEHLGGPGVEASLLEGADGDQDREAAVVFIEFVRPQLLVRHSGDERNRGQHIAVRADADGFMSKNATE